MAAGTAAVEAEAEYHDGRQARPLWLRARLAGGSLELRRAGGEAVASWPAASLRVVDRPGGALRLAPDGSDARLLVADAALAAALEAAQRPRRRAALKRRLRVAALAAVLVPAGALALWKGWPPAADAIARAMPPEWERPLGAAMAAALVGDKRVCDAPAGQAALDALAARLAAAGGVDPPGGVRVRVVDDPMANAFAAPGGEVIFFRGLVDRAGSAEELAGVLAHELAHVKHRHGLRNAARVAGLFVLTGALTGGSDAAAAGAALVGLSYSRGFEREADEDGARMLHATGIGTEGLQAFFARMEADGPGLSGRFWDYVGTHPADAERLAALRAAPRPATPAQAMPAGDWAAVRAICGPAAQPAARRSKEQRRPAGASPAAKAPQRRLGLFGGWEAWAGEGRGGPVCYVYASALPFGEEADEGNMFLKGLRARLMITHRLGQGADTIGFLPGRKVPEDAEVRIAFGDRSAPLPIRSGSVWLLDEAGFVSDLRAAADRGVVEAEIGWRKPAGEGAASARSYRFPLHGLVEAHAATSKACEGPPAPSLSASAAPTP